jgi:tRNA nucleotidyltransferase (CCA-adding enzyme)
MAETLPAEAIDTRLSATLPAGALFAVGGRVRDEVRSALDGIERPAKDLDYVAVGVDLDDLVDRLARVGRADVVGASFAVVKCTIDGITVDVALPRREHSTGLGHRDFQVEWGAEISLEDDLARRDFRMNMMARAIPSGVLVDPYGGAADVKRHRIDILRDEAFFEDPLRMLRACQFAARFEFEVSPETLAAMTFAAALVESVSPERVRDELIKMLEQAARPSIGIELMRTGGLLPFVLPELAEGIGVAQNVYHAYDVYEHALATVDATEPGDIVLRLAALFHDVGKPQTKTVENGFAHFYRHELVGEVMARGALDRLRFPTAITADVARLVLHHMYAADPDLQAKTLRNFLRRITLDLIDRQFALRAADIVGSGLPRRGTNNELFEARIHALIAEKPALSVRDLAVGGQDIIEILIAAGKLSPGSRGGPAVGKVLTSLLESVIDAPELNTRAKLLARARELAMA